MQSPMFNPFEYAQTYYTERRQMYNLKKVEEEYKKANDHVEGLFEKLDPLRLKYRNLCIATGAEPFSDPPVFKHVFGLLNGLEQYNKELYQSELNSLKVELGSVKFELDSLIEQVRSAIRDRIHKEEKLVAVVAQINLAHYMKTNDDRNADKYIREVMEYQDEEEEDEMEEGGDVSKELE